MGRTFKAGEQFGSIESVKAVSDLYCPVSGEVVEVNGDLADGPEAINQTPHDSWMIVVKLSQPDEVADLLDAEGYATLTA